RFRGLYDSFYEYFRDHAFNPMSPGSSTAEVTRNFRCLFYALALTDRTRKEKQRNARLHFLQIFKEQSSQAVC
ncbi:hypothetical protein PMAYCL1PPCAC_20752, partial [Pristionchus mayeri]